jgi:hypothetical protein
MTFASLPAWLAWLVIAAIVAAAIVVFRMKVRPPRLVVPSLAIWKSVLDERREQSWWDCVRRAVSLVLAAVIAFALALAAMRPSPSVTGSAGGRLLLVLDTSWSMRAKTAAGATRWQRAVAEARAVAQSAGGDEMVLATTSDGLVEGPTTDAALIDTALGRLVPAGTDATSWPRVDGVRATHFFTDGAITRALDPSVVVHSVFEAAPNVAVTAFVARPSTSSATPAEAYLEVSNYAASSQRVAVRVTRETAVLVDRTVEIGAGDAWRQVLPLDAAGGPRLGVHVSAPQNALDVDDDAVAWLATSDPISVAVTSDEPDALMRLLQHDPNMRVTFMRPADDKPVDADVLVFDRWLPADAPARPFLAIAPPAAEWLGRQGRDESAPTWAASTDHAVLAGVDPFTLEIARVRTYESGGLVPIAMSARGAPIVSVLDSPRSRGVVLGFSVADSNIASTPAFPVLVGNALEWLAHPASGEPRTPGPMALAASTTRVTSPDGTSLPLVRAGDRVLVNLTQPGLYLVDAAGSRRVVGVNVGRPDIANVMRTSLEPKSTAVSFAFSDRPWWMWAVFAGLALLVLEWVTWQRRVTV